MRFWFIHSSEVSLRAQIVTQIRLGILSGELAPAERLPSVREIARRFQIHPNTVSAAYRQLEQETWVVLRRGSGVYVRDCGETGPQSDPDGGGNRVLDQSISGLLRTADAMGVSVHDLRQRFLAALERGVAKQLLLIEPDSDLRDIVLLEIRTALNVSVRACGIVDVAQELQASNSEAILLVLPSKAQAVRSSLKASQALCVLQISPVASTLMNHLPASREGLIGIASHWPRFLELAKTMLVAAGFPADAIVVRDAGELGWYAGLDQVSAIICDSVTAGLLPSHKRTFIFTLVAESSLAELRAMLRLGESRSNLAL